LGRERQGENGVIKALPPFGYTKQDMGGSGLCQPQNQGLPALFQQKPGQIRAILPGDSCN